MKIEEMELHQDSYCEYFTLICGWEWWNHETIMWSATTDKFDQNLKNNLL